MKAVDMNTIIFTRGATAIFRATAKPYIHIGSYRRCSQKTNNYYDILGVTKTASKREIRAAYIKLSKQHHPDVKPGNENTSTEFNSISEAYKVLVNARKRQEYDYNLRRREDPGLPPSDDVLAQFYQDGTIYRGSKKLKDTGYTNNQIVAIILVFTAIAGIAQGTRVSMVAKRKAEQDAKDIEQEMEDMERITNQVFISRRRLLLRLAEAKQAQKQLKDKPSADTELLTDTPPSSS